MPAMVKWIVLPLQFTSLSFFFSFDLSSCCAWPLSQKSVYARFFSSNHKVQFKILTIFSEISSNQEWTNSMRSRIFSNSLNTVDIWQRDSLPQTLPQSWWRLAVFTWRFFCAPWFHDIFFHFHDILYNKYFLLDSEIVVLIFLNFWRLSWWKTWESSANIYCDF